MIEPTIETQHHQDRLASKEQKTHGGEFIWSEDRCTGCTRCAHYCPVDAIAIIRRQIISKKIGIAPCSVACPAGVDASRYIRFIAAGRFTDAVAVLREKIPFPAVCGYVCFHPCETDCQRGQLDEPILIRALKRFAAENDDGSWKKKLKKPSPTGRKAAIVGSGPAGLTCAYYLARQGHSVTVFEAESEFGGKMLSSILDYELPKPVLQAEVKEIEEAGVEIKLNTRVTSTEGLFEQGYETVLLAAGLHNQVKPPLTVATINGVISGQHFLDEISGDKSINISRRVVILGGGSTAFACANTAYALGAEEVHIVCLEYRAGGEADSQIIDQAVDDGVRLHPWRTFVRVVAEDGKVQGVEYLKLRAFGFDNKGEVQWDALKGSQHFLTTDMVIDATGYENKMQTSTTQVNKGVFAAGDGVSELRSVIEAIAAGRWAAGAMDRYLGGDGDIEEELAPSLEEEAAEPLDVVKVGFSPQVPSHLVNQSHGSTALSEDTLGAKDTVAEANRCLKCDLGYHVDHFEVDTSVCTYCGRCVDACYWGALSAGYGYELAAKEHKERLELVENRSRVYNIVITLLVALMTVLILAIVAGKFINI
jgi:NADPH-dependent glutamate synthase beta subunit-like oxidoreductase